MRYHLLFFFHLFSIAGYAQYDSSFDQSEKVDFIRMDAEISILPEAKTIKGNVEYQFKILSAQDSIFVDAKNMTFSEVLLNGKKINYNNNDSRIWIKSNFKPNKVYRLNLRYTALPKKAMYFINWDAPAELKVFQQLWTQGQGRETSHWLPSFDDMKEKVIINLSINFKKGFQVIANGDLENQIAVNDSITQWNYKMKHPMSSYLVAIAAGKYASKELTTNTKIPISLYFEPKDSLKAEPTYRYSKEMFDFFETEIGVNYPWENYKQVPVQDFLFGGMENTTTTIFSDMYVVDSTAFIDQNFVFINAHELAHQWFGNMVTDINGKHHWLHEGFATYYAWLAEKEIFGDNYYYWKLYESAEQLKELSDSGKGESLLNPKASSLTFYQKGAWALHMLRELVGDENFKASVKNYLLKNAFSNVTTDDFVKEVEKTSKMDISQWKKDWLLQSAFQGTEALASLKKSDFILKYMELAALRETPLSIKTELLSKALEEPLNEYLAQEAIYQLSGDNSPDAVQLYKKAFATNNTIVRQAIAVSIDKIPLELKLDFLSLFQDDSYITIENTLLKTWLQFPEETQKILDLTKDIQGFQDKNVRLLWLTINLVSPEIGSAKKSMYYNELSGYTSSYFPFSLRQNAFGYLYQLNAFSDENLLDLLDGAQHQTSSFRSYSRELLDTLLKEEGYQQKYVVLSKNLNEKDLDFITKRLNI